MKIKFEEKVQREVEITLPKFVKSNCHFWKIYSEERALQVTDLERAYRIEESYISVALINGTIESSEEEFEEAYARISKILNDIKNTTIS